MNDDELKTAIQQVYRSADSSSPDFDEIWAEAEKNAKARASEQTHRWFTKNQAVYAASVAAAIAIVLVGTSVLTDLKQDSTATMTTDMQWIDSIDDSLMSATNWSAPSDALLPQPSIDIYRGLPTLFMSTEPEVETLL